MEEEAGWKRSQKKVEDTWKERKFLMALENLKLPLIPGRDHQAQEPFLLPLHQILFVDELR